MGEGRRLWRQSHSVRFRITAIATVAVVIVLGVTAIALTAVLRSNLIAGIDASLEQRTDNVETIVVASGEVDLSLIDQSGDDGFVQIAVGSTVVIASGAAVGGTPVAAPPPGVEIIRTVEVPAFDEGDMRVLSRTVMTADGERTLHVAATLDDVQDTIAALAASLAIAVPLVAVVLAALVWALVGRTLQPVEAIRAEVASIGGDDLDRRVPEPDSDDEIASLAETMNAMLDRIESATDSQRQFVADASHELRSPLTRLRTQLEVEGESVGYQELHDEVLGMQHLVEDLLFLAMLDTRPPASTSDLVDLDEVVRDVLGGLDAAPGPIVAVDAAPVMVCGDARELRRAVGNVVENANRFASAVVDVTLRRSAESAVLRVTDDGPGIPSRFHNSVFDRFVTVDDARSDGGAGLGLAIAADIVARHGGTIRVDGSVTTGTTIEIRLPEVGDTD